MPPAFQVPACHYAKLFFISVSVVSSYLINLHPLNNVDVLLIVKISETCSLGQGGPCKTGKIMWDKEDYVGQGGSCRTGRTM